MLENDVYAIYIISFLSFVAVLLVVEGVYFLYRGLREEGTIKMSRRIKAISAGGIHGKEALDIIRRRVFSEIPTLNRILISIPRLHALDRVLEQSGVGINVSRFLGMQLLLSAVMVGLLLLVSPLHIAIIMLIGVPIGFIIPSLILVRKRDKRHLKFTAQLPDALDFIARSLRAGNPFSASMKAVAAEVPAPTGEEFGITFDEINYGVEVEDALQNLASRSGSEEIGFFITAVLIQRQTGGNLADVLNRISKVMRDRASTYREIRILSAEMRLSAYVLIALPFFVAAILSIVNPGYLTILFVSKIGQVLIVIQLFLMLLGYLVIRKMINFRV